MGKGTKKKTVWRTFSFENGYTNGTDESNGLAAHHQHHHQQHHHQHHLKNGSDNSHDTSNRSSISNGKFISNSWRTQCSSDSANENDLDSKHIDSNGNVNGHRTYYKRTPLTDKYPSRANGFRKAPSYIQENGTKSTDTPDIHENHSAKPIQFRFNRSPKVQSASRYGNHKKWDSRNVNLNSNGILNNNYSRGIRKPHSDQQDANDITDEHFNENGLTKYARDADDSDKCQDNVNGTNSTQLKYDRTHHNRSLQLNKFNEDEYTRISTPRSEVLFKKGYLMREKKYVGPTSMMPMTTTSSNDSGSVSVVSNEETASYYSIQSMSPDNSTYQNGSDTSPAYPNDGFEPDLSSLVYSSGFYDNSGYFYVNPYLHNNFDQFNGPTILMPYGSAPNAKDVYGYDGDAFPPASMSPNTADAKSVDEEEHTNNLNSINSEEMSNSSLSENTSINNDTDTPPNPLTPPPSPVSPNEKPIARFEATEISTSDEINAETELETETEAKNEIEAKTDIQTDTQTHTQNKENETEEQENDEHNENAEDDAVVPDGYSIPYFSPLIFVPPIPFVPDGQLAGSRRGKYRRHLNNQFGRLKRGSRFPSHFYNKVYIPNNWSEAPEENDVNAVNGEDGSETKSNEEKPTDIEPDSTIEQCDKILKNSKLNLNVSEFIPQSKRMIFVPLPITPSPPAPVYFVPIPSTESTLNVNVPEFLPKNYKPLNETNDDENGQTTDSVPVNGDKMTINTNESAENQNETNRIKGLSTVNPKCTSNTAPNQNDPPLINENDTQSKQTKVIVPIMSDLLKNNSDYLNFDANSSFNKGNSHTNLKADLGYKNDTNNSKKTIYKNDNYSNGSGSSKSSKINVSNKTAKTRQAYPKTKEIQQANAWEAISSNKNGQQGDANGPTAIDLDINENKNEKEKSIEKPGMTYAQMVVPLKQKNVSSTVVRPTTESKENEKEKEKEKEKNDSILSKTPPKRRNMQNEHSRGYPNRRKPVSNKKTVIDNRNEKSDESEKMSDSVEGPIEWFTIGAKGKKHAAPNGSTVIDIAFENESKAEKVNQIAEELQLDIKKDADLAMDIMDSLTINEKKPIEVPMKTQRKKKVTFTLPKTKKKAKDKSPKEQKKRDTFEIIEPCFETQKKEDMQQAAEEQEEDESELIEEGIDAESHDTENNAEIDDFVFDPNVFATPCNLQIDSVQSPPSNGSLGNALRLSTGKAARNLINQFNIYQPEYTSIENQQLKQEEEMVNGLIKMLQQLNKSHDETELKTNEIIENCIEETQIVDETKSVDDVQSVRGNSMERFAINAKPYQNVYSSNHFLEHFFGDRNDKNDHVNSSTDLSSSDQSNVENQMQDIFDTQAINGDEDNEQNTPEIEAQVEIEPTNGSELGNETVLAEETHLEEIKTDLATATDLTNEIETQVSIEEEIESKSESVKDELPEITAFEIEDKLFSLTDELTEIYKTIIEEETPVCQTVHELEIQSISNEKSRDDHVDVVPADEHTEIELNTSAAVEQDIEKHTEINVTETELNDAASSLSCNQSVNNGPRPWNGIRIVDTQTLQQQKKLQQTFPITTAVSMWLNQAQKEKTPEPIFRLPDYRFFSTATKYKKTDSQASYSNSSIDLTEDTVSVTSDKLLNDDEEEDIMNFWESPTVLTPQSPTPPPIYNSVYGSSINYANLLSNKNELLCNNIVDCDRLDASRDKMTETNSTPTQNLNKNGFNQNNNNNNNTASASAGMDEKCYRPPREVCCSIM